MLNHWDKNKKSAHCYLEEHTWVFDHQIQTGKETPSLGLRLLDTMLQELPPDLEYPGQHGTIVVAHMVA